MLHLSAINPCRQAGNGAYFFCKRLLDVCSALLILALLAPAMGVLILWLIASRNVSLQAREFIGLGARSIKLGSLRLSVSYAAALGQWLPYVENVPRILSLLSGHLTLVGPRLITAEELGAFGGPGHPRFNVLPGMLCLWSLRVRSNIDYGTESQADLEYLAQPSLKRDIAILGRYLMTLAYGPGVSSWPASHCISGIRLLNLTMDNLLDAIACALAAGTRTRIAFVNPDCVNIAARDAAYRRTLGQFDWVCADGIGMKIAGSLLGQPVRQNLNGTDLFPRLCSELGASGHSVYLLGSRDGVADAAAQWALEHYPTLKIAGTRSGYFTAAEEPEVLAEIRATGAKVLLVALGAPRQELWLERNLEATGAVVGLGVGGLFDFYSGRIPRAPQWLREIGGEWIYRLIQEPRRMWRRYVVGNWVFLFRIIVEKLARKINKGPVT